TERLHQDVNARLMLHNQFQHDLVEVRPMIPAVPSGDVHDLVLGLLVAIVAPIDRRLEGLGTPAGRRWHAGLRRAPWERGRVARAGRPPICAYLGLFPSLPTPPLCHLLLSVRACTGSLLPPSTRGRFLMDPTSWT